MRMAGHHAVMLAAIAIGGAATSADAQGDPRVRTIMYRAEAITAIATRPGYETMISFAPDERIENVALGDSLSWQVTPNKRASMVFVKPVAYGIHTNMAVVTDKRSYLFELRADRGRAPALFSLSFSYPSPIAAAAPPIPAIMLSPPPPPLLTAWQASGTAALRPERIYDDGVSVYLSWPAGTALPVILADSLDGTEEPATFIARGDYLIVDEVPSRLLVRVGRGQAVLTRRKTSALTGPASPVPPGTQIAGG